MKNEQDIIQVQFRNGRLLFKETENLAGLWKSKDEWVDADGRLWILKVGRPKLTRILFRDAMTVKEKAP